eukprot:scaffold31041_cov56-Attheya_sp.AAC.3
MSNSLAGVDSEWEGDGSNGSLSVVSMAEIWMTSETLGTPFNVMLDGAVSLITGSIYFEVGLTELSGSIAVGVVQKGEFQPGWKTKGMFYNGNVTNGSAGLIIGFGDYLKEGDKVGVLLQRLGSGAVQTVFYLNDTCLGAAFRLGEGSIDPDQAFYPCLHVTGKAKIAFQVPDDLPDDTDRKSKHEPGSYGGDWKLEKCLTGPELGEFTLPPDHDIILHFKGELPKLQFSAKVGNNLGCSIEIVGKGEGFDKIEVGPIMSTLMMPPPELVEVEQLLFQSLPTLYKMILSSDTSLVMTGTTTELIASRYSQTFEPLAKYNN